MNAQVVLIEPISDAGLDRLRTWASFEVLSELPAAEHDAALARADALIVRSTVIDAAVLDRCPRLRVIGRHGVGLENIDLRLAEARGIKVVNTPSANADAVSEFVIAAVLWLCRRLGEASYSLRNGLLADPTTSLPGQVVAAGLLGRELTSSTLGIVGYGEIGSRVARTASILGMSVLVYDPYLTGPPAGPVELCVELPDLLQRTDVLSLQAPHRAGDAPLIGSDELAILPRGAGLINAARAGVCDAAAVVRAVERGHLSGAVIDVYDPEPPAAENLSADARILFTPHLAAMTGQALERMAHDVVEAVRTELERGAA